MDKKRQYFLRNIKSNIDFNKFSITPEDPQKDKIYSYPSEIYQHLKQKTSEFTNIETKTYDNKILHKKQEFKVPVYQYGNRNKETQESYNDFYRMHKRFTKPYGLSTKYVDTINKNIQLIRKCQFNHTMMALQVNSVIKNKTEASRAQTKHTKSPYLETRYTKNHSLVSRSEVRKNQSTKLDVFDKTIRNQSAVYKDLLSRERDSKRDRINLNNSMNKMLAAQMINLNLNSHIKKRSHTIQS